MAFLRNYWYCAGWSDEIGRTPLPRVLLGESLVFYRKLDGGVVALEDTCPHRFAPLHPGKLEGDAIVCRYHGLQFGPSGHCVHNPHGDVIPPAAKVKAYPVFERHGVAWIWMGDADACDTDLIPALHGHAVEGFRTVRGLLHIEGNYELLSDNLLDLSHTQHLHSLLTITQDEHASHSSELIKDGDTLTTVEMWKNTSRHGFVQFVWPDGPERVDSYGGVRWQPPANMLLKAVFTEVGQPEASGLHAWGAELATPETETTSHYFWSFSRDYRLDDEAFDKALQGAVNGVFAGEDSWMIGLIQKKMGSRTDLLGMRPVLLPTDRAAVSARRIMMRLKQDHAEAPSAAPGAADRQVA